MPDRYHNFRELQVHEVKKTDYDIVHRPGKYPILIMAPHGGSIEPFTSEISRWIAAEDFSLYLFQGLKKDHPKNLHITSHHFDEPEALNAVSQADLVLTVHGLLNSVNKFLMIGGLDVELCARIKTLLTEAGFSIQESEVRYSGRHPDNICNRGRRKKGVQLEITYALRKHLSEDLNDRSRFITAIRSVLFDEVISKLK